MSNYSYIKKLFYNDNFFKIPMFVFIGLILFISLTANIVCCIEKLSPLFSLSIVLKCAVFIIIFFLFISYEFFLLVRKNEFIECVKSIKRGELKLYFNQIRVISSFNLFLSIILIIVNVFFSLFSIGFDLKYILYVIIDIFLNVFLCVFVSTLLGLILSFIEKRIISYLLMLFFVIILCKPLDIIWNGLYNEYGIDLSMLTNIFSFQSPSISWMPIYSYAYSILPYRFAIIGMWLSLLLLVFNCKIKKIKYTKLISILCIVLLIGNSVVYAAPKSELNMGTYDIHDSLEDEKYYRNLYNVNFNNCISKLDNINFNITSYDIELDITNQLSATVILTVDNKKLKEYVFTLYHGFKVSEITDINNNRLPYEQFNDYIRIFPLSTNNLDKIIIKYDGYNNNHYSNLQGIFLPDNFPFYPVAGVSKIYNLEYNSFIRNSNIDDAEFFIKVFYPQKIYCNFKEIDRNTFCGKGNSVILLSGFYKSIYVDNVEIIYPYLDIENNSEEILKKSVKQVLHEFDDFQDIEQMFIIPKTNQGTAEETLCFDKHILTSDTFNLAKKLRKLEVSIDKWPLYEAIDIFQNDKDLFNEILQYHLDNTDSAYYLIYMSLKNVEEETLIDECCEYLYNKYDCRSIHEFFQELQGE